MAIDTQTKRRSVQGYTGDATIVAPVADGTIAATDRQHITGLYAGIAAARSFLGRPPANRSYAVPKHNRRYSIAQGDRRYNVAKHDRTYSVEDDDAT